ncbi:thiamine phosphate synthase [Vallitalea guaymasensis]|uniref:Thiamine phosphate synthase n=1 Tax=Vallitalea guaymasensis TaxID=1185412 RepID=A0A8J8SB33_9FIRM|nr:thiamine phosphate synthase [Vallitalea guaymasensis]QUH28000.1 thiamine phosphate synthase [Vallitalea guaymasensis]
MLICVTNRKLCRDNFIERINKIAEGKPHAIMLREKDMDRSEYECLALKIKEICNNSNVELIINNNIETATKLGISNIHLSMSALRTNKNRLSQFTNIGASVHSLAEAKEAGELGASYIIAGHIFPTDCKQGVPPRGISFLQEVCHISSIPVFAIGGITSDKKKDIIKTGAKGMCIMSQIMNCTNPIECIDSFEVN